MKINLHQLMQWFGMSLISCLFAISLTYAQSVYPVKPIRLIVPFTPGGVTDTSGRYIADQLSTKLGQQVVVENRPGASGNIGSYQVASAEPDGYTLLLGFDGTLVINPHVFEKISFDTVKDFSPIGKIGDAVLILVANNNFPGKTVNDMIAISKKDPQGLSYGTSGAGSSPHIAGELLKQKTGANLVHIPYKGTGVAVADLVAGQIHMVFSDMAPAVPFIKANKLRALAVTSPQRSTTLPDLPTMIELGFPHFEAANWWSIVTPKGVPNNIIERINQELGKIMTSQEIKDSFEKLGVTPLYSEPSKVFELSRKESPIVGEILRKAGVEKE